MITYTAEMTRRRRDGRSFWVLYVVTVAGPATAWPEYAWPRRVTAPPTPVQRRNALALLGYTPLRDGPWRWTEGSDAVGVTLTASAPVTSARGGAS